eukprot:4744347-Amphidinium_carterae.1
MEAPPSHKKQKRATRPNECCIGRDGQACTFSTTSPKQATRVQPKRGETQCAFCNDDRLRATTSRALNRILRGIQVNNNGAYSDALEVVNRVLGQEKATCLADAIAKRPGHSGAAKAKAKVKAEGVVSAAAKTWKQRLVQRQSTLGSQGAEWQKAYEKWTEDDRKRRDRKFGNVFDKRDETWMTSAAQKFLHWTQNNSWFMCQGCQRMEMRKLEPMDIKSCRTLPQTKKCKHCARGTGYPAPQLSEVPEELRDLTPDTIAALRPVEIDCGHPAS